MISNRTGPATIAGGRLGNQHADAQRNLIAILAVTPVARRRNPDASVTDIAAEAGVRRVTLHGHFRTRAELIEAAVIESLDRGDAVLSEVPLDGDPTEALTRLIASSWNLVDPSRWLLAAAQKELSAARVRELHQKAEARMRGLLERGQREGAFRCDLRVSWLLTTAHVVMNAAADEITADRVNARDAPHYINAVLQPAFNPAEKKERS